MTASLREDGLKILKQALHAADPVEAVLRYLRIEDDVLKAGQDSYELGAVRRIFVVGAGKASAAMAAAVERVLGSRITSGIVSVKYGHTAKLERVALRECGHPAPDENGIAAAREIANVAAGAKEDDLVICVLSGGASALLPFPAQPITLAGKQAVTKLLLDCGANIGEINTVRKHISSIKGGQLAALAYPARVVSLLLSDVIGDDLAVIGSGVTAPDPSTYADALAVLDKYELRDRVPEAIRRRLEDGSAGLNPETPKSDHPAFLRTANILVGSNQLALEAAATEATRLGYTSMILASTIEGETRDVARMHAAIARELSVARRPVRPPVCVITGGETTVTIRGNGKGGRNQEFALAAAIDIAGLNGVAVLSAGTDGSDGPTDAAGAIVDGATTARGDSRGADARKHLAANDSYTYLALTGDLLITGPTNTNVMDVHLMLVR